MNPNDTDTPLLIDLPFEIETVCTPPKSRTVYKYFSTFSDRDSFLNGNIWFAGMNRNRFYMATPHEYNYTVHQRIFAFALSFTTIHPNDPNIPSCFQGKAYVEIPDVNQFILAIKKDLLNSQHLHQVSWLDPTHLVKLAHEKKYPHLVTPVRCIATNPTQSKGVLTLPIISIIGKEIDYYDEKTCVSTLSIEAVNRAANLPDEYAYQKEYRITLNSGGFIVSEEWQPAPGLHHLVNHIKIKCPSTTQLSQSVSSLEDDYIRKLLIDQNYSAF